jgi:hypothetical protein
VTNGGSGAAALGALAGLNGSGDTTVHMTGTGPDSNNQVDVNNSKTVTVTNTNVVEVQNTNLQGATSGNVSAYKNTTAGGLSSGDASNTNHTVNTVTIGN